MNKKLDELFTEYELELAKKTNLATFRRLISILKPIDHEMLCASLAGAILVDNDFDNDAAIENAYRVANISEKIKNG